MILVFRIIATIIVVASLLFDELVFIGLHNSRRNLIIVTLISVILHSFLISMIWEAFEINLV